MVSSVKRGIMKRFILVFVIFVGTVTAEEGSHPLLYRLNDIIVRAIDEPPLHGYYPSARSTGVNHDFMEWYTTVGSSIDPGVIESSVLTRMCRLLVEVGSPNGPVLSGGHTLALIREADNKGLLDMDAEDVAAAFLRYVNRAC